MGKLISAKSLKTKGFEIFVTSIKEKNYWKMLGALVLYLLGMYFLKTKVERKKITLRQGQTLTITHKKY